MFVADALRTSRQNARMLDSKTLLAELHRLRDSGVTNNAEIGRLLALPSSRVSDIFSGKRAIKIDEMKLLVERYGLEDTPSPLSADAVAPLLDVLLPIAPPPGRVTEQSRRALAEALAYGLALLGDRRATPPSSDAAEVAARAAVTRFRELMN